MTTSTTEHTAVIDNTEYTGYAHVIEQYTYPDEHHGYPDIAWKKHDATIAMRSIRNTTHDSLEIPLNQTVWMLETMGCEDAASRKNTIDMVDEILKHASVCAVDSGDKSGLSTCRYFFPHSQTPMMVSVSTLSKHLEYQGAPSHRCSIWMGSGITRTRASFDFTRKKTNQICCSVYSPWRQDLEYHLPYLVPNESEKSVRIYTLWEAAIHSVITDTPHPNYRAHGPQGEHWMAQSVWLLQHAHLFEGHALDRIEQLRAAFDYDRNIFPALNILRLMQTVGKSAMNVLEISELSEISMTGV